MSDRRPENRVAYPHFLSIPTRWMDNDIYGHVNNVTYYSYFDTVINEHLIRAGKLDIHDSDIIGVCAESHCLYLKSFCFPDTVEAGLRVAHLGSKSAKYEIGLFHDGDDTAAAQGWFVHVFVDQKNMNPVPIPAPIYAALSALQST